jgi:large subunit ribosomal protein L25
MKKYSLSVTKRDLIGKKVKAIRKNGQVPATVYGKNVASVSLATSRADFEKLYAQAGETGLVDLKLEGDVRPVLIQNVQKHPIDESILHVEFRQVDLKEKVKANVPIELTGDAPVVADKKGVLLTVIDEVEVEALPSDLPEKILVDTSKITDVGQEIRISDLTVPASVTILSDATLTVVRAAALVSKEAEQQAAVEAEQQAAASALSAETPATPGDQPVAGTPASTEPEKKS